MEKLNQLHLKGKTTELVPLQAIHAKPLVAAATDGKLWELPFTSVPSAETIDTYLKKAQATVASREAHPFAVVHKASGNIIGSTRYYNIEPGNRRLSIGYTWYAKSYQRSSVNTECKLLLLEYAFEQLEVIAVEFMTHYHNFASRAAIARLGARQDGVLRNHRIERDGTYRDSVVFSMLPHEWPAAKAALQHKLAQYSSR